MHHLFWVVLFLFLQNPTAHGMEGDRENLGTARSTIVLPPLPFLEARIPVRQSIEPDLRITQFLVNLERTPLDETLFNLVFPMAVLYGYWALSPIAPCSPGDFVSNQAVTSIGTALGGQWFLDLVYQMMRLCWINIRNFNLPLRNSDATVDLEGAPSPVVTRGSIEDTFARKAIVNCAANFLWSAITGFVVLPLLTLRDVKCPDNGQIQPIEPMTTAIALVVNDTVLRQIGKYIVKQTARRFRVLFNLESEGQTEQWWFQRLYNRFLSR